MFLFPSFISLHRNINRVVYIAPLQCPLSLVFMIVLWWEKANSRPVE